MYRLVVVLAKVPCCGVKWKVTAAVAVRLARELIHAKGKEKANALAVFSLSLEKNAATAAFWQKSITGWAHTHTHSERTEPVNGVKHNRQRRTGREEREKHNCQLKDHHLNGSHLLRTNGSLPFSLFPEPLPGNKWEEERAVVMTLTPSLSLSLSTVHCCSTAN